MGQRDETKLSAVVVELIVVWEKVKSEIHALLTPEQRERLQDLQAEIEERIQNLLSGWIADR